MLKKIISLFTIMSVILVTVPAQAKLTVVTTKKPALWETIYTGSADTNNCMVAIEEETVRTDNYSMNIKCTLATTSAGNVVLRYALPDNMEQGNYMLSFYLKGTYTSASVYAGVAETFKPANVLVKFDDVEDSDGWTKYTQTINYTGEQYLKFQFVKGSSNVYIDDIAFTKGSVQVIDNCGFETVIEDNTSVIETDPANEGLAKLGIADADSSYIPHKVMLYNGADDTTISWKNPEEALSSVKLYENGDDGYRLLSEELDTTSEAYVKYTFANDDKKMYKICFTFEDGEEFEYFLTDNINSKKNISNWTLSYNGIDNEQGLEVLPMSVWVDNTEKHGADLSFKISSNATKEKEGNVVLSQEIDLKPNTDYVLHLWKKEQNAFPYKITYGGNNFSINSTKSGDNGWECVVYNLKFSEKTNSLLELKFEKTIDALWLDDIEMYELDSDKMAFGDNLVKNGDFEETTSLQEQGCVSEFSASPLELAAKLSWTTTAENVVLYKKNNSEFIKIAEIAPEYKELVISNLEADTEQQFVIKVVSEHLNDSVYKTVTVTPTKLAVEIGETQITKNQSVVTVKKTLNNNFESNDYTVELIVALFEDNVMTKIESSTKLSIGTGDDDNDNLKADINIDGADASKSEVRIYLWNGAFDMDVLVPVETVKLSELK